MLFWVEFVPGIYVRPKLRFGEQSCCCRFPEGETPSGTPLLNVNYYPSGEYADIIWWFIYKLFPDYGRRNWRFYCYCSTGLMFSNWPVCAANSCCRWLLSRGFRLLEEKKGGIGEGPANGPGLKWGIAFVLLFVTIFGISWNWFTESKFRFSMIASLLLAFIADFALPLFSIFCIYWRIMRSWLLVKPGVSGSCCMPCGIDGRVLML